MTFYTAADLIAQKEAGYQEARKFCERYRVALEEILLESSNQKGYHARVQKIAREALK